MLHCGLPLRKQRNDDAFSKYRWEALRARSARVRIMEIIEDCKLRCAVALRGKGVAAAVAAFAMALSAPSGDGGRSSWRIQQPLARGAGGKESFPMGADSEDSVGALLLQE